MLFERRAAWLSLRLRRRFGDPAVAQDVIQGTFVGVWKSAGKGRGDGEGCCLDLGLRGRDAPSPASGEALDAVLTPVESAEDQVLLGVEHSGVGVALNSPGLRRVVQATLIDGLSTRAAAHGLPQGTVKGRLRAAKSRLRADLAPTRRFA